MTSQQVSYWLLLVLVILHLANGRRSSSADSKVNADGTVPWPGHLEPLGAKAVKRPVPVLEGFPSPETFYADYILGSLPVVFRNGAKLSPAFKTWSDKDLSLRPEAQTTMVEVETRKKEDRSQPMLRMKFAEFLERYNTEDEYMIDTLPKFLRRDVIVPPPLVCDEILGRISDAVIWFSSGGTKSVLHNDDTDNINCLFSGQKDILFLNYTQYRHQFHLDNPQGSFSSVDVDKVDMIKYPGLRDVEFYLAKLFPGDCIYIPYKWMHQVNSVGRNIAVNVWFDHSCEKAPSPEICGRTDRKLTLEEIQLTVEKPLDFEENFEEDIPADQELIETLKKEDKERFNIEDFNYVLQKRMPLLNGLGWTDECDELSEQAFDLLDITEDGILDKEDFEKLKDKDEIFRFQLESKLLMLSDIAHEQDVQERVKAYDRERNERPAQPEDPSVLVEHVEPLNLADIDWGTDDKKDSKKPEDEMRDSEKREDNMKDSGQDQQLNEKEQETNSSPHDDKDIGVDIKVEL